MIPQPVRTGPTRIRHTANSNARYSLDPFTAIRTDVVRSAAVRVSQRWSSDAAEIVSTQDVVFELLELSRTIENPDNSSLSCDSDAATLVLRTRLLQELRQEIVAEWAREVPSSDKMLRVLAGLERTQSLIEPPSPDGMAKRLSDAGGLDLVVEVAHDLRSPLTSILFLAETMLRGHSGELTDLQQHQLSIVYGAALQLISTASDMVELARGAHGEAEPLPMSLKAVLDPVRDLLQPIAQEKGVELRVACHAADRRIGMAGPLGRVLLTLASNAVKFAEHRYVEIAVVPLGATRVEFSVRDNGSGIEPDELNNLFHPFRRRIAASAGYQFSGIGLGLNICRKLVRAMGGELQLETAAGWGTRFFFELDLPPVTRA